MMLKIGKDKLIKRMRTSKHAHERIILTNMRVLYAIHNVYIVYYMHKKGVHFLLNEKGTSIFVTFFQW